MIDGFDCLHNNPAATNPSVDAPRRYRNLALFSLLFSAGLRVSDISPVTLWLSLHPDDFARLKPRSAILPLTRSEVFQRCGLGC